MRIFITDIETNNLYQDVSMFHCAWIFDVVTGRKKGFRPHELKEYIMTLGKGDIVVGHNIIDYDLPTLAKLVGKDLTFKVFDTIVLSRMLDPDKPSGHSLDAWGRELGILKGTYGKVTKDAWEKFTEEMFDYCEQDVAVTQALYHHLCKVAEFDDQNPPCNEFLFKSQF